MMYPECTVCKTSVGIESPYVVHALNFITLGKGWMRGECAREARWDATYMPSSDPEYRNRYEQALYHD